MSVPTDPPDDPAGPPPDTSSSNEIRDGIRRLQLRGAAIWTCRYCRTPIRAVNAASLPEDCPECGHGTWAPEGRCAITPGCGAVRPADGRRHVDCAGCGGSIWHHIARI